MEIPRIGSNCDFNSCNQLDFLPIVCDYCHKIFCKDHSFADNHNCSLKPLNIVPENHVPEKTKHSCSITNCPNSELTPIICSFCSNQFCLSHRHQVDHECPSYKPPSNPRAEAAAKIEELTKNLASTPKKVKKVKNDKLAAKVQLMKIKGKAIGNKELPYEEKVFFSIFLSKNEQHKVDNPLAVFVSHYWSVGKALDAIADLAKIRNRNNEIHAPRLELFRVSDGTIVKPLDVTIKDLMKEEKLFNGQPLILEFVPKETYHLENYAEYDE
ncbi:UNVERIFIED_CONTAM: hypothetical protein RMT77_007156 [Armadillidium vulgare]